VENRFHQTSAKGRGENRSRRIKGKTEALLKILEENPYQTPPAY